MPLSRSRPRKGRHRKSGGIHRHRRETNVSRRRRLANALQRLEPRHLLAFSSNLFADINQFGVSSIPDSLMEFNGELLFVANDGRTGSELWKSDGTAEGTRLIADINPGPAGSLPASMTRFGNELYFTALDADDEFDLWKTDGTAEGTVRVFDADASGVYELSQLTASGNRLFFTAFQAASGYELWSTDGTSAGTALVKDINPDQTIGEGPRELTDVAGKLFFSSYTNGYDNRELFESDGTASGTLLVANIDGDALESSEPRELINFNGTLYFTADTPTHGVELYKSTGASGSTVRITDINPGSASTYPESLTPFDGQLFFTGNDGVTGRQLFKTDGNTSTLVANTTTDASGSSAPSELTVVGNELFFVANGGGVPGPVSADAPTLTADNSFRASSTRFTGFSNFTTNAYQGTVAALTIVDGNEVTQSGSYTMRNQTGTSSDGPGWVAEGARIGAVGVGLSGVEVGDFIIQDMDANDLSDRSWEWSIEDPAGLSNIDFSGFASGNEFDEASEALLFELFLNGSSVRTDFQQVSGDQLDNWLADRDADNLGLSHAGGPTITSATVRLTLRPNGGAERLPNDYNEGIVIRASLTATGQSSGEAGRELHKTDGNVTTLVKDIVSPGSSLPLNLTEVNGKLYFSAEDPIQFGRELWTSDGTEGGTVMVKDIRVGSDLYGVPLSGSPENLTEIGGTLFFSVVDDLNDREIWTSQGTAATTNLLKNINPGTQDANVQQMVKVGSKLFFVADDGINGQAVWIADPGQGTVAMAADVTASSSDRIHGLAKFGNGVIFHNDSLGVYTTDGTTTTPLIASNPVAFNQQNDLFLEVGPNAFFVLYDTNNGEELWKTNGTAAGTVLVSDLVDGPASSQPRYLVEFQNKLFFSADSQTFAGPTGREVFSSDGTAGGTQMMDDINFDLDQNQSGGTLSSDPRDLTVSNASLYFTADSGQQNGNTGRELWVHNGNVGGARLVSDIRSGANSSNPTALTDVDGVLFFAANDGSTGVEPFRTEGTAATTNQVANINTGGQSSDPSGFLKAGSTVYFSAFEETTGVELYATDGTPAGTSLVDDLQAGINSSDPKPLAAISGGRLLVAATGSGTLDREFWIVGGPISGIKQALDMNPGELFGSNPTDLIPDGSNHLFVGNDGLAGRELYRLEEFAPVIESEIIDDGTPQRSSIGSFQLIFNSQVEFKEDPFEFTNLTTGKPVDDIPSVTTEDGKTVVTFAFAAGDSVNAAGLLADGDYQLIVRAANVDSLGTPLDGDQDGNAGDDFVFGASSLDKFYRKFGDYNGNETVDLVDFAEFRRSFGSSTGQANWNHAFDQEGDGSIGLLDFAEFRRNFGT